MFGKILDIVIKLSVMEWMYVCLGVIGLVFIIGLILTAGSGAANKFKGKAKAALKHPDVSNLQKNAKEMPFRVRKLYKRVKASGEKPSDVISLEACVTTPYAASFAPRFGRTVMAAAMFMSALMLIIGMALCEKLVMLKTDYLMATAIVILAGFILRFLAGIISMGNQKSIVKVYEKYVSMLDNTLKAEEKIEDVSSKVVFEDLSDKGVAENANAQVVQFGFDEQPKPIEAEQNQSSMFAEINAFADPVETINADAEQAKAKEAAEQAARIQAEQAARIQAEQAAKAQAEQAAREQAEIQSRIAEQTQVTSSNWGVDDVVSKIDKIAREGASLSEMKEVAMQLQRERAKQENKTAENSRRLNEALASLLKSLSTATKK